MSLRRPYDPATDDYGNTPFKLNISNALGIDSTKSRAALKNYALQDPAGYSALRDDIYVKVVQKMVEDAHGQIWKLLALGKLPDDSNIKVGRNDWSPALPDQEIGKLANGFAESMMDAFSDIMDKIMPDDYSKLANDKMMNIAKVKGINNSTASAAAVV